MMLMSKSRTAHTRSILENRQVHLAGCGRSSLRAFLREREIVHALRFKEAVEIIKEDRDQKKGIDKKE